MNYLQSISADIPYTPIASDSNNYHDKENYLYSRAVATQGMILLKNNDGALPLAVGSKLAVFGMNQADYIDNGGGAAAVNSEYKISLLCGLQAKEALGKLSLYKPLAESYLAAEKQDESPKGRKKQIPLSGDVINADREFADTAIISIGRFTEEGFDMSEEKGGYYLSDQEQSMIDAVCKAGFRRVIAVLNIATAIDTSWFKDNDAINAVLLSWLGGMEGGNAMADILCGDVNPSGRLPDTLVKNYADYHCSDFNSTSEYADYTEDIYVGYRYFETIAPDKVNYEFGYGLSYTEFEFSSQKAELDGENIKATVTVKNIGDRSGKQVVQVYYSAPQGKLGKPAKVLAGFEKTKELAPGEAQQLTVTFPIADMASYDDTGKTGAKSAYVLEPGEYAFYIGSSVRQCTKTDYRYKVDSLQIVKQLSQRLAPRLLKKRLSANGSYEPLPTFDSPADTALPTAANIGTSGNSAPEELITATDVYRNPDKMPAFLAQMSLEELANIAQGQPGGDTGGIGNLPRLGVATAGTADGPLGLHLNNMPYPATAWPCAILTASSFDKNLIREMAERIAEEAVESGIDILLGPSMNIHRSPLCGRNFEYYSEDPLLAGSVASAFVNGLQSKGIGATVKHFAINNKETDRRTCDSRISERAAREIYLSGFKRVVDNADPWAIMSSYNPINGIKASANFDLLTAILRDEWGYPGMVMSDWDTGAPHALEAAAGGDVKMPNGAPDELVAAVNDPESPLTREILERNAARIVRFVMKSRSFKKQLNQ